MLMNKENNKIENKNALFLRNKKRVLRAYLSQVYFKNTGL